MHYSKEFAIHNNFDKLIPGLYVIDSKTGAGKTTCVSHLFNNLIQNTQHTKGLYISMNDNKDVITNHFIKNITGFTMDQVRAKHRWPDIEKAYVYLIHLAKTGKINLLDHTDIKTPDDIRKIIMSTDYKGMFVIIDGMLDFETKGYQTIDNAYYDMAHKIKRMVKNFDIPIVCTADKEDRYIYEKKADALISL
jgi:replicative DNA helicase